MILRALLVSEELLLQDLLSHLLFLKTHLKLHCFFSLLTLFRLVGAIGWELNIDRLVSAWFH